MWFPRHRIHKMFSTIRQFCVLFKLPAHRQTNSLLKSLASNPIDLPPDEGSVIVEESDLWKDYAAVGFDLGGNLDCLTANACWE